MNLLSSLRARIALFALVLFCVPLLVLGLISNQHSQQHLTDQSLQLQQSMAERVSIEVSNYLGQRIHDLQVLERISLIPRLGRADQQQLLERLLVHEQAFHELALFDRQGIRQWVSRNEISEGLADSLSAEFLSRGFSAKDAVVSESRLDPNTREPMITIGQPVVDRRSGETSLLLIAVVRMKPIWDLLASLDLPAQTEAYLVDKNRQVIAHREPSTALAKLDIDADIIGSSEEVLIVVERALDFNNTQASIVITRTESSVFHVIHELWDLVITLTVVAIVIALILGISLASRISAPVEELSAAAARIADGEFETALQVSGPKEIQNLGNALQTMAEKLAEQFKQLADSEFVARELAHVTLQSIGDAVISTDETGNVMFMNPPAEQLTGWTVEDAAGREIESVFHIIHEETRDAVENPLRRAIKECKVQNLANHTSLISRQGQECSIQDSAAPIIGRDNQLLGAVMVFSDVTEQRALMRQIKFHAKYDSLTELTNRREFERRLQRATESAADGETQHTLCYLDLDNFKIVNDSCGHAAGDEVLRQVSNLFLSGVGSRDTLGRIGGDEFVVLMEHCNIDKAVPVADKLRRSIENFRFPWEGRIFSIGVSIGMVEINQHSGTANQVLQHADSACYLAKDEGRSRIRIYSEEDGALSRRSAEIDWVSTLNQALQENSFELYAQEIKPLHEGQPASGRHFELLLRMINSDGDRILPGVFMQSAERYKLMPAIDQWVVETSLHWIADNSSAQSSALWGINLSGQSLGDEEFLEFVKKKLDETGVNGEQLCFEITETAAISNLVRARDFIEAMRKRGCKMALDDFGSGLSSFAYLKSLPVDYLKIDGQFVRDVLEDELDFALVRSINEIGRLMNMQTIAEYVETPEILERIRHLGITSVQGFAVDIPKPLSKLRLT